MLESHGLGANTRLPKSRNGLGRGMYNRLQEESRFPGKRISTEAQYCLETTLISRGSSAYHLVFASPPADPYARRDDDGDPMSAQQTSVSGQSVQRWKLRLIAQEAALNVLADSNVRRLLAHNRSSDCTAVKVGDSTPSYTAIKRESAPRRRGQVAIQ